MNATFGLSECVGSVRFDFQVNLDRIVSSYPSVYPDVVPPFNLPAMKVGGGGGTIAAYVGTLVFSMATPDVSMSPRSLLGEHPSLSMLGTGGRLFANVQSWVDDTHLGIRFVPDGEGTKHYTITAVVGTDGVVRWKNPADN